MRRGTLFVLGLIVVLAVSAWYIDFNPGNHGLNIGFLGYSNDLKVHEGLDLKGGFDLLYQAQCP